MILTADWHLDDRSENEYRWEAFAHLHTLADKYSQDEVCILGDLLDRKDKHPATLLNRLTNKLASLAQRFTWIHILMGNHDYNVNGPAYCEFINKLHPHRRIRYYTKPTVAYDELLLLPFSPDPHRDWEGIDWSLYKAAFIHQCLDGARYNGMRLEGLRYMFPRRMKVYAGDIHQPQEVGPVTYVGAPHPCNYGDDYETRMLVLNGHYQVVAAHPIPTIKKHMLRLSSLDELRDLSVHKGDQARIEFALPVAELATWAASKQKIAQWADAHNVSLASVQAVVQTQSSKRVALDDVAQTFDNDPFALLQAFATEEGLTDTKLLDAGMQLLREET